MFAQCSNPLFDWLIDCFIDYLSIDWLIDWLAIFFSSFFSGLKTFWLLKCFVSPIDSVFQPAVTGQSDYGPWASSSACRHSATTPRASGPSKPTRPLRMSIRPDAIVKFFVLPWKIPTRPLSYVRKWRRFSAWNWSRTRAASGFPPPTPTFEIGYCIFQCFLPDKNHKIITELIFSFRNIVKIAHAIQFVVVAWYWFVEAGRCGRVRSGGAPRQYGGFGDSRSPQY